MGVLRTVIAVFVIAFAPSAAWAQRVTSVPDGDTLVVDGVGKIHLLGIKSGEQSAVELGPTGPPAEPSREPPTTPAISGSIHLKGGRPSRDLLRKLALGKTVHIEYDSLIGTTSDRTAYVFLDDGTLLNAAMLKAGRARVDPTRQFVRETEFKRLEAEAQSAAIGIWVR
jgi:endonuclease YncB( thermonuclease family)